MSADEPHNIGKESEEQRMTGNALHKSVQVGANKWMPQWKDPAFFSKDFWI